MFWLSDKQLDLFISRDETVFGEFYIASIDIFYRYLKGRYFFHHEADIKDIISDAYVKIWKWMKKYNSKYSLEAYIRSIFKNHLKDYFKKNRLNYSEEDEMGSRVDQNSWEDMYIELAEQQFTLERIHDAMDSLEEVNYQILFFKLIEWYSYEEISDKTWLEQPTLRKRYSRALSKLKSLLEKWNFVDSDWKQ